MTPKLFSFSAGKQRFMAAVIFFCISVNSFCPRAIIELKNYDVVALAMGSQTVFLHLFALPNKVSVELANLLFNDKPLPLRSKTTNDSKTKTQGNSSSDFSILCLDQMQNIKEIQLNICHVGAFIPQAGTTFLPGTLKLSGLIQMQGMLYCVFMLLFFSRPRGDIIGGAINLILNNTNNTKPGLYAKPGFLFCEVLS